MYCLLKREEDSMQSTERDTVPTPPYPPRSDPPATHRLRTGAIIILTLLLISVFGVGLFAGWQFSGGKFNGIGSVKTEHSQSSVQNIPNVPPFTGLNEETIREAVVAKVRPAIVQVNVVTETGKALGSGVIIDQRGYIVTNNHVIAGARQIQVMLSDGTLLNASVVGATSSDDIAVLKVTAPKIKLVVVQIGDSSTLRVGQEVLALGNPLGITQTVTRGIVSALGRSVGSLRDTIQTDAAINPGNSGGALIDLQGRLVGIPTATAVDPEFKKPANGVGFAIPSNRVQFIVPQLMVNGKVINTGRAALGVNITSIDPVMAKLNQLSVDHGALVVNVLAGSAAEQAGMKVGDIIVQVGDKPIDDVSSLTSTLISKKPGDTVTIQIYRGKQQMKIDVKLAESQAK
jgi:S1-C subfamily serine protease